MTIWSHWPILILSLIILIKKYHIDILLPYMCQLSVLHLQEGFHPAALALLLGERFSLQNIKKQKLRINLEKSCLNFSQEKEEERGISGYLLTRPRIIDQLLEAETKVWRTKRLLLGSELRRSGN